MTEVPKSRIVVGVDGSESSIDALRWAARQAELTGATLYVITAWAYPNEPTPFGIVPDVPLPPDHLTEVHAKLDELIEQTLQPPATAEVRSEVVEGHAASVLVDCAGGADLLVLGCRGRGALAEMVLGSVSEHCVRHAPCPVVVIRHEAKTA